MGRVGPDMDDVAGSECVAASIYDSGAEDFPRRDLPAILNGAADEEGYFAGLNPGDIGPTFVKLGFAGSFAVRKLGVVARSIGELSPGNTDARFSGFQRLNA